MASFSSYKKDKKNKDESKGVLSNLKAPVKITKKLIKKGYNKLDLSNSNNEPINNNISKLRANVVRASLISSPNSNPSLSRMTTGGSKRTGNVRFNQQGINVMQNNVNIGRKQMQLDTEPFFEEEFDAQAYLEGLLEGEQWTNLKSFYSSLQETSEKSSLNLQSHVYRNYKEFVNISKEISKLETEMFELRHLIDDLQNIGNYLASSNFGNGMEGNNKSNENNEEKKESLDETNRKELAKLWKAVQGSQEYLPYVEDRRPLLESPGWKEIEVNNFRFKRNAHFFLLTDSLLIATRAKRQTIIDIKANGNSNAKLGLMARSCIKFNDMVLQDIKDSNEVKDAFKIIFKNEQLAFVARNKEEKKKFLRAIARATSDYFRTLHQKALLETSKKVGESLEIIDIKSNNNNDDTNKSIINNDFWDALDIAIAHHQYKDAVDLILEAKTILKNNNKVKTQQDIMELKERIVCFTLILEKRVKQAQNKNELKICLQPMIKLNLIQEAQHAFLIARDQLINLRIRQLPLDGSTVEYIKNLSELIFNMLSTTCKWHSELFQERSITSRLIYWVRNQLDNFGKVYHAHVFSTPPPSQNIIDECKKVTEKSAMMLHSVGLDLNFQLERLLAPDVPSI